MADHKIEVTDNGPYIVESFLTIVDADGNEFVKEEYAALCRCGQSSDKPFCDGTHRKVNFESTPRAKK